MNLFGKDLSSDTAIIAEVGVNHEGSIDKAVELLHLAAEAGADAVKYQSYTPARYASASDPERLQRVTGFCLDEKDHATLAREAKIAGVTFFSTPLTEDWVPLLDRWCPAFKIASGDLTFEPVIRAAAGTGKPVIISTGGGALDEIDQAVSSVREEIGDATLKERLILMQCVAAYPTPIEEAQVNAVPFLAERYDVFAGYSNHIIGDAACLAAIALGARLIEVHFTDRKTDRTFRDHELSFEPSDLSALVDKAAQIHASLGDVEKTPRECELGSLQQLRKGLVAARDLPSGHLIKEDDITYARPAIEFTAREHAELINKKLIKATGKGELFRRDNITA